MNKEQIIQEIAKLKKKRKAVILVHNYQPPKIQDIADYVGDSLGLSREAAKTDAEVIIFCGVHFMAETAAMLSPDKKVLLPDQDAGCPMADMITAESLRKLKEKHPKAKVVCYVNSTAEVKAESDICCTSSNAVRVIEYLEDKEIIFVPDKYLGYYAGGKTGKDLILWQGYCPTHVKILPEHIIQMRKKHPGAKVLVHPECLPTTIKQADEALSTGGIINYAHKSRAKDFIIGTEIGILYRLKKENPEKNFYPATRHAVCPNMKKINLDRVLASLRDLEPRIKVDKKIRQKALRAIEKMLQL
jgi:quinolinate synthase